MTIRAALDVGSNSLKLLVLDIAPDGGYAIRWNESRVTGLGRALASNGTLHPAAVDESLACLQDYRARIDRLQATLVRAVGTAALREAADAVDFISRVAAETGINIEVISGAEEARLSRSVALRELPPGADDVVFFDVGGSSTEITWCHGGTILATNSLALGARRCTEVAGLGQPVMPSMQERLLAMIGNPFYEAPRPEALATAAAGSDPVLLAGLGGTATTLVWLLQGLRGEGISDAHQTVVSLAEIDGLLATLRHRSLGAVRGLPNLDPRRADVIYAGASIIAEIIRYYRCSGFTLVDRGLRFGVLLA